VSLLATFGIFLSENAPVFSSMSTFTHYFNAILSNLKSMLHRECTKKILQNNEEKVFAGFRVMLWIVTHFSNFHLSCHVSYLL